MDFWQVHGWFFLIGLVVFPRLTMLIAGTVWKFMSFASPWGILAWIGWVVAPSFLVAILATTFYWDTNPGLCVCAWVWALLKGGSTAHRTTKND
jgi:hypothetical protein